MSWMATAIYTTHVDSPEGEAIAFGVRLPEAHANVTLPPTPDHHHHKVGKLVFALLTYPALRARYQKSQNLFLSFSHRKF